MGADVMSAKHRCNGDGSQKGPHPANPVTQASVGRLRPALLASASLVALAALGLPSAAAAACVPSPQTISGPVAGPVVSNGGAIKVTGGGGIARGEEGVFAENCSITTLSNMGSIGAAIGAPGAPAALGCSPTRARRSTS